jgi:hypothetical protein
MTIQLSICFLICSRKVGTAQRFTAPALELEQMANKRNLQSFRVVYFLALREIPPSGI